MTKIIDIEGIGEVFAGKLQAAGIDTVEELLEQGGTPAGRKKVAASAGLTDHQVLEWVNRADLYRINGVGSEYSDLLETSGVDTVRELAQRNATNLQAKMEEVNVDKKIVRRVPSLAEVEKWVAEAKTLPVKVTY